LADVAPMKQLLAVKGRFPPKVQPKEAAPSDTPPEGEGRPAAAPGPRGRGAPPAEATPPEGEAAAPPPSGAYLTVNPNLKSMLDLVERQQPVVSVAVDTQSARGRIPPLGLSALEAILNADPVAKLVVKTVLDEARTLGASLQLRDGLALTLAEDCQSEDAARKRLAGIRRETGPELAKVLTVSLGTRVEMEEDENNPQNPSGEREQPTGGVFRGPGPLGQMAPRPGGLGTAGGGRPGGPPMAGPSSGAGARGGMPPTTEPERPK